jgi:hypothetical protein
MAKTRTDLIHRALRNLGVLPQGQSPSAQEYDSVSDLVDPMVEELFNRNIAKINSVDDLEEEFFIPLGHILAWYAAPEFGSASDPALAALSEQAEVHLKYMYDALYREQPHEMRTDYPITRTCRTTGNFTNGCF